MSEDNLRQLELERDQALSTLATVVQSRLRTLACTKYIEEEIRDAFVCAGLIAPKPRFEGDEHPRFSVTALGMAYLDRFDANLSVWSDGTHHCVATSAKEAAEMVGSKDLDPATFDRLVDGEMLTLEGYFEGHVIRTCRSWIRRYGPGILDEVLVLWTTLLPAGIFPYSKTIFETKSLVVSALS